MTSDTQRNGGVEEESRKEMLERQAADDSQASDNDGGERPVRNKLKETSITSAPKVSTEDESMGNTQEGDSSRASSRGRKRSFDEDQTENNEDDSGHRRKRSRDSNTDEENAGDEKKEQMAEELSRKILSPKKKRSRDQLDKDDSKIAAAGEKLVQAAAEDAVTEKSGVEGQPEKKRHTDDSREKETAPVTSAFTNPSSVSPFGAIGAAKSKEEESSKPSAVTSSSAFAASSLAAFASSEQSPFGSLGSSTPSIFKSPSSTDSPQPAATGFAAAAGTSGFAALGSGFSGFSGGFGSAKPAGGLTSFASPAGPSVLSTSKATSFGVPDEEEDKEEDDEEAGETGPGEFEQDKTDERFYERPIETGEEDEKTYFSCKAKLFQFTDKEWKERGIGTFKVNVRVTDGVEDKKAARMIMRADGVLRVMLNTPIFKGMTVGDGQGKEPKSKQIHLASLENDRSIPILLRTGSEDLAKELYRVVRELQEHQ